MVNYIAELVEELNTSKTEIKKLKEQNQTYQEELNRLKGEQAKPKFEKQESKGNKQLPKNKKINKLDIEADFDFITNIKTGWRELDERLEKAQS